jgi:Resolvase, N terminal domain
MSEERRSAPRRGKIRIRCAIYTRKSSKEGLEQEFNSLDAQRLACEAYVKSQKHEGWDVLPEMYDDGGVSGATMERPALQHPRGRDRAGARSRPRATPLWCGRASSGSFQAACRRCAVGAAGQDPVNRPPILALAPVQVIAVVAQPRRGARSSEADSHVASPDRAGRRGLVWSSLTCRSPQDRRR